MSLFTTFLKGESIHNLDGIIPMTREQMQKMERRGEERVRVLQSKTQLTHRELDVQVPVTIVDVTFFGMYLKMDDVSKLDFVNEHPRDLALHLEDEEGTFSIECLIFESTEQGIRALFKHGSFELADRLSRFIARQKQTV
jgi:hypothetical protein